MLGLLGLISQTLAMPGHGTYCPLGYQKTNPISWNLVMAEVAEDHLHAIHASKRGDKRIVRWLIASRLGACCMHHIDIGRSTLCAVRLQELAGGYVHEGMEASTVAVLKSNLTYGCDQGPRVWNSHTLCQEGSLNVDPLEQASQIDQWRFIWVKAYWWMALNRNKLNAYWNGRQTLDQSYCHSCRISRALQLHSSIHNCNLSCTTAPILMQCAILTE